MRLAVGLALALALVAACGKAGPDRNAQCKTAAHDAITALVTNAGAHDIAPRFEATLENHCIDDKWPAASIECYRKATSFDAMRACRDALPADARTKLQTAELDLLGGGTASASRAFAPTPQAPHAPLTKAEQDAAVAEANELAAEMKQLGTKINAASQKVAGATDANRAAAKAELDTLTKQADELRTKLAAAQAKATGAASAPANGR